MLTIRLTVTALVSAIVVNAFPPPYIQHLEAYTYQGIFDDPDEGSITLYTPTGLDQDLNKTVQQYQKNVIDSNGMVPALPGASTQSTASPENKRRALNHYDPTDYRYPWLNCTWNGEFVGGCNKEHAVAPKQYYNKKGYAQTKTDLTALMTLAFENPDRGLENPRSFCYVVEGNNLCVSWHRPIRGGISSYVRDMIVDWAMQCVGPSGLLSSMFRTGFPAYNKDGKLAIDKDGVAQKEFAFVCVSNRANGCTLSNWFCTDLYLKDPDESHLDKPVKFPVNWEPTSHTPWAQGPCTDNCDQL